MQAMIGLPSGEERVRWNPSAISPQPSTTPRIVAPRASRMRQAFQHQRAGALRHHETVAILAERARGGLRRVVAGGQRRQQREADQALGIDRGVGADAPAPPRPRRAGSPRRRAGSRSRRRRRRWRWRSASPWCRSAPPGSRPPSRTGTARSSGRTSPVAGGAQQIIVADGLVRARRRGERPAAAATPSRPAAAPGTSGRESRPACRCRPRPPPPR